MAHPWWVNLAAVIPVAAYLVWRREGLALSGRQLLTGGIFAIAFGFLEAAVVVYLRAATGLLPGGGGAVAAGMPEAIYRQADLLAEIPQRLLHVEVMREAATMVMLTCVALLASRRFRERWAMFLWTFAIWDIVYYGGLRVLVNWPGSLRDPDVLFLIPVPWLAPVWFPLAVSGLMIAAILAARARKAAEKS